jgi:microcystin-dependent protein
MSEPFLGQLAIFGFNFAPYSWALCQGQIVPISQYTALFSLIGTIYGGNGTSNFQLPNLQGAVGVGQGTLSGGSTYQIGQTGGLNNITLTANQMPMHNHALNGSTAQGTVNAPANNALANPIVGSGRDATTGLIYNNGTAAPTIPLSAKSIAPAGAATPEPHTNVQPYLAMTYCICMSGVYPQRS